MLIKQLNERVAEQLNKYGLTKKFDFELVRNKLVYKQRVLFQLDTSYPGLNTEKLEPEAVGLFSFRIDKQYRAIFRIRNGAAEIIHITKHYRKS